MAGTIQQREAILLQKKAKIKRIEGDYLEVCKELQRTVVEWRDIRWANIRSLSLIVEELKKLKNDTNIAELSGAVAGLVGSGLTAVGLVTTVLTFGLGTPLLIAGLVVSGAGSATSLGADITDAIIGKKKTAEIATKLQRDFDRTKQLLTLDEKRAHLAEDLKRAEQEHTQYLRKLKARYPNKFNNRLEYDDMGRIALWGLKAGSIAKSFIFDLPALLNKSGQAAPIAQASSSIPSQIGNSGKAVSGSAVAKTGGTLAKTGGKVAYSLSWAGVAFGAVVNIRTIIDKSRHIHLYNTEKARLPDDATQDDDEDLDEDDKQRSWVETVTKYITDPFLDMTISERAEKLQKEVRKLRQEVLAVENNEIIQEMLNEYEDYGFEIIEDDGFEIIY